MYLVVNEWVSFVSFGSLITFLAWLLVGTLVPSICMYSL